MTALVGLDVGTTGVKALALSPEGEVLAVASRGYKLSTPHAGWAEQDPEAWVAAAESALREVGNGRDVAGIGFSGQMHGLVVLDRSGRPIRPAILWNDQRTGEECREIEERVGLERLIERTGNRALTGFTAPKLLWLRRHEPDAYARIARVLLPKDYVRLRLTGEWAIDASDASGTLLLDVERRAWSEEVLDALELPAAWLPPVLESPATAGAVLDGALRGTPVAAGAGDQPAAAIGVGVDRPGALSVVLGTSGVVLAALPGYAHDPAARVHAFCHAVPGTWQAMGVMLSAAGSLEWFHSDARLRTFRSTRLVARGGGVGARRRGAPLPPVPGRRAHAACRPGRAWRVRRAPAEARPRGACPCGPRGRRVRPARLARPDPRAGRRDARGPGVGWRRAQPAVAPDRRLGARPAARADRVGGRLRVRRCVAREASRRASSRTSRPPSGAASASST